MHAQITIEETEGGTTFRTYIALTSPGPYNPTVAADLLDKVRATHDELLARHDEEDIHD